MQDQKEQFLKKFEQAVRLLPEPIAQRLLLLPPEEKASVQEVRLRAGRPLSVWLQGRVAYVSPEGELTPSPQQGLPLSMCDLDKALRTLCDYSLHTHGEELRQGFLSLPGGHRAGLCGTAVYEGEQLLAVRETASINLRIARETPGAADALLAQTLHKMPGGLLIAGAPGSGKTTLLRDLARQISDGALGAAAKVAVVDERGELGAASRGEPGCDIGQNTDLLTGYHKAEGMLRAIRTLSPQYILCDEIGPREETQAVAGCIGAGATVITTIHAASREELSRRPQYRELLATGGFAWVALLAGKQEPCRLAEVWKAGEDDALVGQYLAGNLLPPVGC